LLGPFEEEEKGISIASDVVEVEGEDPATTGDYLRSVDTRKPRDRNAGGRINFLRRESSDLFGELFSERNSFIEDGSDYSFYEEILLDLK